MNEKKSKYISNQLSEIKTLKYYFTIKLESTKIICNTQGGGNSIK